MPVSKGASVPLNIVARQMSVTNFEARPASNLQVLAIATATCLLALFLCSLVFIWLQDSLYPSFPEPDVGDVLYYNMKTPKERDGISRAGRNWASCSLGRPRSVHDRQRETPQESLFAGSAFETRFGMSRKSYTITGRHLYKSLVSNPTKGSIRRKNTTLDMEEGLSLISNATNGYDYTRPAGAVPYEERGLQMTRDHSDISFLHRRTAS